MAPKLIIWDLDETILTGILEEGGDQVNAEALDAMTKLHERGVLQALATQNSSIVIDEAVGQFSWMDLFVRKEADLGSKADKVRRVHSQLDIHVRESVFVDDDVFERDSIRAQIPEITTWSVKELTAHLKGHAPPATDEARSRPRMYRAQHSRSIDEEGADDYEAFLRSCNIQITIRPYVEADNDRVRELLTRTHRMNLGVLDVEEAISRLSLEDDHSVVIAEMRDIYSDMGRCGVLHITPRGSAEGSIESLAISCRTRSRGLSLAMLVGLLRYPAARFERYRCRYAANDRNRPLRMLLLGAGFRPVPDSDELLLDVQQLDQRDVPDWVQINYPNNASRKRVPRRVLSSPKKGEPTPDDLEAAISELIDDTVGKQRRRLEPDEQLASGRRNFDSVAILELVLRLEKRFGVGIPDEDLDPAHFRSIRTLAAYIYRRLNHNA